MINFQGVQGGVGYNDTASDQDSRRRQQLAQLMLQQSNATPAVGWTGALNKILSGAIAGYQLNKDGEEQKARGDAKSDTLARALSAGHGQAAETKTYGDGTAINWNERKADPQAMAAILAGNRDTAPMGLQMQIGQMDEKRKNEAATAAALLKRQNDREDEFYKPIKTEDGSVIVPAMMPGFQMPGQAPRAPAPQAPGGGVDMRTASAAPNPPPVERQPMSHTPGYVTQVTGIENGTGNPAARNPRSSAMGNGQFIDATWLDIVKRNRQDIAQGKSDQDILALRADPKLSAEMTDIYGMENADALRSGGIQNVGNAEKYAAHFFGPTGAIKVLQADPNASFASVLSPEVIKANPQLAKMTVGQWREQNAAKFGGGAEPPAAPAVQPPANTSLASALSPGTIYQGKGKGVRTMTAEELRQNGLPKGASAQIDGTGKINLLSPGEKPRDVTEMERNWRTDFKEPIKQATELSSQIGIIKNATARGDGTGDIAAITAFNKLLDPGAVVREADVALTMKAQGLAEQLQTWMANKQSGDVLPPELRTRMAEMADQVYQTSNAILKDRVMPYRDVIEGDGGKFDRVLPPTLVKRFNWGDQPEVPPRTTQTAAAAPKPAATKPAGATPTFATPDDPGLAALPSGSVFLDPNGVRRIKP